MASTSAICARILRFLLVVPVLGCAHAPIPDWNSPEVVAALTRGGCDDECPAYTVVVKRDGTVMYDGTSGVRKVGRQDGRLDASGLLALEAAFDKASFFSLRDRYVETNATCQATMFVGDRSAPESLHQLENEVDRILKTERWTGEAR